MPAAAVTHEGAAAQGAALSPPLPLLATKLYIPQPRLDLVPRPRLLAQLEAALRGPLTVLVAPAGWGKSSVVATWCASASRDMPVAWVSLDAGDNDPVRFWTYILSALNAAHPGVADEALAQLRSSQPPPIEPVLTLLINGLAAFETDTVLVLDDYHSIEAEAVHASVTFLLDHLPPRCHLVLATREDPPLPLARRRAEGTVTELRAADLRFTPEEAANFLAATLGIPLSDESVRTLEARSEGWIAGLRLAALSLQGRSSEQAEAFVTAFAGSNRYIVDYLVEEVLARQLPEVQTFLLRTAMVERFCAALCERLLDADGPDATGMDATPEQHRAPAQPRAPTGAHAILERVERANLFLIPLDDERRWYRYHHLFADVLRSRLRQLDPTLPAALLRQASVWCDVEGLIEEAVAYALASSDFDRAADLIEQHGFAMGMCGRVETVLAWLQSLPEALGRTRPLLRLCDAAMRWESGQVEATETHLRDAEAAVAALRSAGHAEAELRPMLGIIALLRSWLALLPGDVSASIAFAREAEDLLPSTDTIWRTAARYFAGRTYLITGDVREDVERELAERTAAVRASSNQLIAILGSRDLANLRRLQGRLQAAAATLEDALQPLSTPMQMPEGLVRSGHFFAPAEIRLERNDLEAAEQLLTRGMLVLDRWVVTAAEATRGYFALTRLQQARGEYAAALATLDAFVEVTRQRDFVPELVERGAAAWAQLQLSQGDLGAAAVWAARCGLSADDADLPFVREASYLALARVRIAEGQSDPGGPALREAERLLGRLLADAEAKGRGRSVLEILILRALAQRARRDMRGALGTLAYALAVAQPEGYVRLFADEGAPMAALLGELLGAVGRQRLAVPEAMRDYAQFLRAACQSADGGTPVPVPILSRSLTGERSAREAQHPVPDVPPLLDPLTERELEVLRLLAEGASNAAIAAALVVTVGTVKKHVFNVCAKLGARNRTQAVARARAMHLL